jgi:hypothetical protein
MKKLLIIALGVGIVGSVVPSISQAQELSIGIGAGPRYYDDRPDWRAPPPRAYYGGERTQVYRERPERECWIERRIVETPYGPERRRVRVCE